MPSLPLELERYIFEIAASQDTDHNSRVRIILVAKRVYEWIRPILYRIVMIVDGLSNLNRKAIGGTFTIHDWPDSQIINSARFVRHLLAMTCMDSQTHLEMISTFPNLENLAMWGVYSTPELVKKMKDLPLRILSVDMEVIGKGCLGFKNLTHLEIFNLHKSWDHCRVLIQLPKLTHLCFDTFPDYDSEGTVIRDLLEQCALLRVLFFLMNTTQIGGLERDITSNDPRYLILVGQTTLRRLVEEWERSAHGLIGCWELAERIVEARKANLFTDKSSFMFSRKTWIEDLNDDGMRWYEDWSSGLAIDGT